MNRQEFDTLGMTPANNPWVNNRGVDCTHEVFFWWMQQHQEEFWSLLECLQKRGTKTILEIGSSHGGTITFFDQIVGSDGLVIGVEGLPEIAFSVQKGGTPVKIAEQVLIEGLSQDESTFNQIKEALADRPLDFLFIDGDHSYEGCKRDFEIYSPLVKPGGLIGFHDAAIEPRIIKFLDELEEDRKEMLPVHYMGIMLYHKA